VSTVTTESGQVVGYTDHGGSGPAMVMLHGFMMTGEMFAPQVEAFGGSFRCVTVDLRGHGESVAAGEFDFWDEARDVLAVLDALGVARAVLVGTSQGGFVALRVALLAPERVLALVLTGTSAEVEDAPAAATYREVNKNWRALGPIDPLIDSISDVCLGDYPGAEEWKARWREMDPVAGESVTETLVARDAVLSRLGELTMPALVMHGAADAAYPVDKGKAIAAALPGAGEAVIVPGGAHYLSLTSAEAVNASMRKFLAANVAATAG
jgi:pimeloyl-ACP methyl ester carboxylesterase